MINAKEIINKPIYELKRSVKVGEARSLLVDIAGRRVNFLLIEQSDPEADDGFKVNILRFEDLTGKGDYALTIADQALVRRITSRELFDMLFADSVPIIGLDLYAANHKIGQLVDFSIDPDTGLVGSVTTLMDGIAISIEVGDDLSYREGRLYIDPDTRLT